VEVATNGIKASDKDAKRTTFASAGVFLLYGTIFLTVLLKCATISKYPSDTLRHLSLLVWYWPTSATVLEWVFQFERL